MSRYSPVLTIIIIINRHKSFITHQYQPSFTTMNHSLLTSTSTNHHWPPYTIVKDDSNPSRSSLETLCYPAVAGCRWKVHLRLAALRDARCVGGHRMRLESLSDPNEQVNDGQWSWTICSPKMVKMMVINGSWLLSSTDFRIYAVAPSLTYHRLQAGQVGSNL